MKDLLLGQEAAFPTDNGMSENRGMSKRFYAACAAMNKPPENINIVITDDDVLNDKDGYYVKGVNSYFSPSYIDRYGEKERYILATSFEHRYVRALYAIADELLKQEQTK